MCRIYFITKAHKHNLIGAETPMPKMNLFLSLGYLTPYFANQQQKSTYCYKTRNIATYTKQYHQFSTYDTNNTKSMLILWDGPSFPLTPLMILLVYSFSSKLQLGMYQSCERMEHSDVNFKQGRAFIYQEFHTCSTFLLDWFYIKITDNRCREINNNTAQHSKQDKTGKLSSLAHLTSSKNRQSQILSVTVLLSYSLLCNVHRYYCAKMQVTFFLTASYTTKD